MVEQDSLEKQQLSVQKKQLAERRGRQAERVVMCAYMLAGYWPVARRLRKKAGELDLVMRRGKTLIGIEVKYRRDFMAEIALPSVRQQMRLRTALQSIWVYYESMGFQSVYLDIVVLGRWSRFRRYRL